MKSCQRNSMRLARSYLEKRFIGFFQEKHGKGIVRGIFVEFFMRMTAFLW